jgi:phosphoglycerate dehydrogenase-like enzyme
MTRVAILDDYQGVALSSADWKSLGPEVTVQAFHERLSGEGLLAERLADFEAIVVMRERTHLPGSVLQRLPKLRLLVTTGMINAATHAPDGRAHLGINPCSCAQYSAGGSANA